MPKNEASYTVDVSDRDDTNDARELHEMLRLHIESEVGPAERRPFSVIAKTADGKLVGGARGFSHWKWLYISHLWVKDTARSSGLGAELMKKTENEARMRGCLGLYVDTFSPEARDFYVRQGFEDFGRLDQMPLKGVRYFLKKRL